MAERKKSILETPPQVGPVHGNAESNPNTIDSFLAGLMGQQEAGSAASAAGAVATLLPVGVILRRLGIRLPQAGPKMIPNPADAVLREHVIDSPRLREFASIEEAARNAKPAGWRTPSPPGANPPTPTKQGVDWPREDDLDQLRTRLKTKKPKF